MLPAGNLVGRVSRLVGSWDLAMADQPVWMWPSGLRLSRFFAAVR
jgi:signal peptidase I